MSSTTKSIILTITIFVVVVGVGIGMAYAPTKIKIILFCAALMASTAIYILVQKGEEKEQKLWELTQADLEKRKHEMDLEKARYTMAMKQQDYIHTYKGEQKPAELIEDSKRLLK